MLAVASCGGDEKSAPTTPTGTGGIDLTIRVAATARGGSTSELRCRPGAERAAGALVRRAPVARLCSDARALTPLLTATRPARRMCTQLYGGPQTARISGTIDGRRVDRTFRRTNGCEIEQYARISKILPR